MSDSSSPGWPGSDRADDERLARSLAAGNDPEALIQLLDRYAARMYDYCHALLRDQETAAGALHDAMLAAYAHVVRLQEPDRFRGWLYALVRNECLRRLQDPRRPAERYESPEVEDMFLSAEERAQQQETRRMVHNALAALRGRERESLDLLLRHGLDVHEVAAVLAIDAQEASDLVGDSRRRLDDALAAVIIARTGREDCPSVAAIVQNEWPLPQATAHRLIRHIQSCAVCTERRHRTVSTAGLLQVLPVAMMPADLRGHIISTATDPMYAGDLTAIARRAEPFDAWGWPLPAERPGPQSGDRNRGGPPRLGPAIAAAAAVILLAVGAFLVIPGGSGSDRTSAQGPTGSASAADPSESPADPSESPSDSPTPTPSTTSPTPTPTLTSPTPTPRRTIRPSTRAPSSRPPATVTLNVGSCSMTTAAQEFCTFTVTAAGGPISWSISGDGVEATPGGGTLGRGESDTVTAFRPKGPCKPGSGTISFVPNGVAPISWSC